MRTMYRVEQRVYADYEGRGTEYTQIGEYKDTLEEAIAYATTTVKRTTWTTGDYKIIERTMDEKTFTVTDNEIVDYNYYKEVGRYEIAKETIECYTKEIERVEASKVRCKTEKGIAKKDEEIARYKRWIAEAKAIIAEKE